MCAQASVDKAAALCIDGVVVYAAFARICGVVHAWSGLRAFHIQSVSACGSLLKIWAVRLQIWRLSAEESPRWGVVPGSRRQA
ncbi:hypothetical protein PSEUDO8AS_70234 [Pseudomonas sp. 8AS]|nr:hypothetical protein PSEUDO8AS_70234 [Pseudomonas sp. 8AS]